MSRFPRLAVIGLLASLPALALAEDVEYREPAGVDADAEWEALPDELTAVVAESTYAIRGEILTTREDIGGPGPMTVAAIVVDEWIRGDGNVGAVVEIEIPLDGPISGDRPARPVPVRGYNVIVFLDEAGDMVDGGLFLVEGGFAWRPNRAGVLLSPRLQRDWEDIIDPIGEYDVFALADVRTAAEARRSPTTSGRKARRRR